MSHERVQETRVEGEENECLGGGGEEGKRRSGSREDVGGRYTVTVVEMQYCIVLRGTA